MIPDSHVQYVNQYKNFEPHEENQLCGRFVRIQVKTYNYYQSFLFTN